MTQDALTEALAQLQVEAEARRNQPPQATHGDTLDQSLAQLQSRRTASPQRTDPAETRGASPHRSPFDILRNAGTILPALGTVLTRQATGMSPEEALQNPTAATMGAQGRLVLDPLRPVARGVIRGVNETVDLAAEVGTRIGDSISGADLPLEQRQERLAAFNPNEDSVGGAIGRGLISFSRAAESAGFRRNDAPGIPVRDIEESNTAERAVEGIAQTITGFMIGGRVLKMARVPEAAGLMGFARGALQGGIGDFIAFDGNDERLSNLIESVPQLRNPVTQFLQANESDDELEGRLKNVLEGLGAGAMIEGFLSVLRGTRALARGDARGAAEAADAVEREVQTRAQTETTARETVQARATGNAEADAAEASSRGPIASAIDAVRQRFGLGARPQRAAEDAARELEAVKLEAGEQAARAVDIEGLTPEQAAAQQASARAQAAQAAEVEFKRIQDQAAPETAPGSNAQTGPWGDRPQQRPRSTAVPETDIPDGVFTSREDVQSLLEDAAFKRFEGPNDIKCQSAPKSDPVSAYKIDPACVGRRRRAEPCVAQRAVGVRAHKISAA